MTKRKRILLIMAVLATLILAIIAVVTAVRLQQIGTQPVAPNVPKSKPKAQANQCQKSWTIVAAPSLAPTTGPSATPTPTGGGATCHYAYHDGKYAYRNDPNNAPGVYYNSPSNKISNGGSVIPGDIIVYEVDVQNAGTTPLAAQLFDTLDPRLDFMDADTPSCAFDQSSRKVSCALDKVAPGIQQGKRFRVKIRGDAAVGALNNTATLSTSGTTTDTCLANLMIVSSASPTPTPTTVPSATPTTVAGATNTPTPGGAMACTSLDLPGGTTRKQSENISFVCNGNPSAQVTQCRFRFGDGSAEVFEDDCNVIKSYSSLGTYAISCEVRDTAGNWHASSACNGSIEIVSGPTSTPAPGATAYPTNQQSSPKPSAIPTVPQQALPAAGGIGQTIGVIVGGIGVILLGLLMLL